MTNAPGNRAKDLVATADAYHRRGNIALARNNLGRASDLKVEAERYLGPLWQENHRAFTEALLAMAVLHYKLGDFKQGDSLARRAQAWADDPNCSSRNSFELSFTVRKNKTWHFLSGLTGWLRSALPAT